MLIIILYYYIIINVFDIFRMK